MNRQEAKQLLPIIQAYAEGKTVQLRERSNCPNCYVDLGNSVHFDTYPVEYYRIKPEPKYRPFENAEECWEEMQKHQPFGWIKCNDNLVKSKFIHIDSIRNNEASILDTYFNYTELNKFYSFVDGIPFGIKE